MVLRRRAIPPSSSPSVEHRRALRHRDIDANRRRREGHLLQQLDDLTARAVEPHPRRTSGSGGNSPAFSGPVRHRKRKRQRATVLSAALQRLQFLEDQYERLSTAEEAKTTSQGDPSQAMVAMAKPSLLMSSILSSPFCYVLFDVRSGSFVDGNSTFIALAGWSRTECVSRLAKAPPYDVIVGLQRVVSDEGQEASVTAHRQLVALEEGGQIGGSVSDIGPTRWNCPAAQYPRSFSQLQELYAGKRRSVTAMWRMRFSGGRVFESEKLSWISMTEKHSDEAGRTTTRPKYIATVFEEGMRVE